MRNRKALFIEGNRNCYGPEQRENFTMTVGELIECLMQFDEDAKVFLRNDEGYTFGSLEWEDFNEGIYNEDMVFIDDGSAEYDEALQAVYGEVEER